MAASPFTIPTITEDNLRAFHTTHYGSAPAPKDLFATPHDEQQDQTDDDGLGYYSDGVKRTLTDEQIALFRHTELQKILRQRRREREARDSEREEAEINPAETTTVQPLIVSRDAASVAASATRQKPAKRNNKKQKSNRGYRGDLDRPNKRKWQAYVVDSDAALLTHRRIAREMDELPVASSSVDDSMYGDDDIAPAGPSVRDSSLLGQRKLTSYVD